MKELSEIKDRIKGFRDLEEDIELLGLPGEYEEEEFQKELSKAEKKLKSLEKSLRFSDPLDKGDAILNVHSGAGGVDAQDWAMMILKMYQKYVQKRGWTSKVLFQSFGEQRGIKNASLEISGPYVFGHLKNESGVHRLVRVSPFSAKGLRHTSFALVEVLPELTDLKGMKIEDKDLKIETFKSSGPGGQHMQKTESAIRITHIPTNIVVSCQSERSQVQNKETCMKMLRSKLYEKEYNERREKLSRLGGEKKELQLKKKKDRYCAGH